MLEIASVCTRYGHIEALQNVSVTVSQGEIVTLIGANGAGKTTLLMTTCGDPSPCSGSIHFQGEPLHSITTTEIMQLGIAIVPEGRRIFPGLTVEENLAMGGYYLSASQIRNGLEHAYHLFPRLLERQHQRGGTLSGGEQQMLAIGRALMSQPTLLLMDEPSLGLAPLVINQIFSIMRTIRDEGTTIFLVEQNAHRALQVADRGYVLENGRVVLEGSGADLLQNSAIKKAYLGG